MAQLITVRLSRVDAQPWGLRLQGGKDFGTPLVVQKVNMGSIADQAGLVVGDALIKVNDIEAFNLRHKDAQDLIVKSGNSFEITVQRGGTWRPLVTPTGSIPSPVSNMSDSTHTVTKTSLAYKQQEFKPIGSGYNNSARPFNSDPVKSIVNKQYNTPVGIYSEESIAETLSAQAEVLAGGVLGVNFKKNEKVYNSANSEVLKALQESENDPVDPASSNFFWSASHAAGGAAFASSSSNTSFVKFTGQCKSRSTLVQDVNQAVIRPEISEEVKGSSYPKKDDTTAENETTKGICDICGASALGVFVRIKDKNLHVDCFKCATCGTSLKNQGYFNLNNKLYCDIHAKMAALNNPPSGTEGYFPVPIQPNTKLSASTISAALNDYQNQNKSTYNNNTINSKIIGSQPNQNNRSNEATVASKSPLFNEKLAQTPSSVFGQFKPQENNVQCQQSFPPPQQNQQYKVPQQAFPISNINSVNSSELKSTNQSITGANKGLTFGATSAPRRGRGILNNPGVGGRIPQCGCCNAQIRGPFITALGKIWCPDHFVCVSQNCQRPLQDIGFVEEKGDLYCEYCFEKYLAPPCDKCNAKIKGDCLNAIGKHFHPECFTCTFCGKLFGNSPFFLEEGQAYCETDWNEMFTTKCFACGFPVEAGDRWVEALSHNYHSQCFNCTMCKKNLEGQSFFAKSGRPYCKNHAR